jgi:23S rRNA pseudouridine1911/1915/1917 synthase
VNDRLTFEVAASNRLDRAVQGALPDLSRSRVAKLIRDGHVSVEKVHVLKPAAKVSIGARITVYVPPPVQMEAIAQDLPLTIVYEDEDLVVVNKAPGMVVHPGAGHADGTLVNALLHHVDDLSGIGGVLRPGIVHRLDKGTSGLMVVAKNDDAHHALAAQFADRTAGRRYLALCVGVPGNAAGTITSNLGRHPKDRVRFATVDTGGKVAITHWERLGQTNQMSLIRCKLGTGRTHQVRVHLSEAGWPIAGDPLYWRKSKRVPEGLADVLPNERAMLHAWELTLVHPSTGDQRIWTADPPADFQIARRAAGL